MKFLRNHWYDLGVVPFLIALVFLITGWSDSSFLEKLALINFMVLLFHQFEEYRFPGGEPAIRNIAAESKPHKNFDRYPLNQNNAMIINVFGVYVIYLLPVFMPDRLWISFVPIVAGLIQFVIHGVITPKKLGNKFYSPGLVAVLFGHVPVAILWFCYVLAYQKLTALDVLLGFIYLFLLVVVFMQKVGYGLLVDENSKYPFPEEEMNRGGYIEKIKNLQHT